MIPLLINDEFAREHLALIKPNLIIEINKVIKRGGLAAMKIRKKKILSQDLKIYLQQLVQADQLDNLITAAPDQLENLIDTVFKDCPSVQMGSDAMCILYYLFIDRTYNLFNKWTFINRISVNTCVYCNRNYTIHLDEDKRVKPQLDHFYPKDKYPFLGISYYNLIPSCQTCNGPDCKHNLNPRKDGSRLINPYLIKKDDFRFIYQINSIHYTNQLTTAFGLRIQQSLFDHSAVFKLADLYAHHGEHVAELVIKSTLRYGPKYREYLRTGFKHLGFTATEIDRMVAGNFTSDEELHKRPLSKLYSDIARELGIIE